jgi:hypothetical protein
MEKIVASPDAAAVLRDAAQIEQWHGLTADLGGLSVALQNRWALSVGQNIRSRFARS